MLTNDCLLVERPHHFSGVQRVYDLGNGYGLSALNGEALHSYPFAWEFAVIKFSDAAPKEDCFSLDYDTPLTDDVVVCESEDEANAFVEKAIKWARGNN